MRQRQYSDSELAHRLKDFLIKDLGLSVKDISQVGTRVYMRYKEGFFEEEYVGVFQTERGKRVFSFHLENPRNNFISSLKEGLKRDKAVLRREELSDYRKFFKRIYIGECEIEYERGKKVPSAASVVEIRKIPLGKKGRLSEKLISGLFYYNIQPVVIVSKEHRTKQ